MKERAGRMAPLQRRTAILDAIIPLIRLHGSSVRTKDLASAAGVSEGTIFSVFANKDALLAAAFTRMTDTEPAAAKLAAIDTSLSLEARLTEATAVLIELLAGVWQAMVGFDLREVRRSQSAPRHAADFTSIHVAKVFEPSRDQLRVDPVHAAKALVALVMTGANSVVFTEPLSPEEIVSVLLDGIRRPE